MRPARGTHDVTGRGHARRLVSGWAQTRRRGRGKPTPTHGLRPAPAQPAGVIEPHSPYPSSPVLTGGFVARSQPHRLRGTAPPRTGGRGRSVPFRSRPHGLGGCLKGSPAGVPPAPHRKDKNPLERGSWFRGRASRRGEEYLLSLCPYKRPTAAPRTTRGGHRAPSPYPSSSGLSGGFWRVPEGKSGGGPPCPPPKRQKPPREGVLV